MTYSLVHTYSFLLSESYINWDNSAKGENLEWEVTGKIDIPPQEFRERWKGTPGVPLLTVWGWQANLTNRVILATWRISGYLSGQQFGYSYMWGFVVIHLQLNISYLSNPECLITCSWSIKLFLSLSQQHLSSCKGRWEGKLWQQWGKGPQPWPSVLPTSYRPYSSTTEDSVGSPEGYPDIQITNFNSLVKISKPKNLE